MKSACFSSIFQMINFLEIIASNAITKYNYNNINISLRYYWHSEATASECQEKRNNVSPGSCYQHVFQ